MKKILVVDDEPDVAELMKLFLDSLGYETDIFLLCEEALAAVDCGNYWAAFCDYMMPRITGDRLYEKIKAAGFPLARRFVIITGAVMDEKLDNFLKREGVRVINKPFKLDEIKNILSEFERM